MFSSLNFSGRQSMICRVEESGISTREERGDKEEGGKKREKR